MSIRAITVNNMTPIEQELKEKYSNIRFELYTNEKFKRVYLTGFIVPVSLRGTGVGTSFMEDLTRLADQHGYQITLTPDSSYGGNVNRLKDFYKRFGFVFNKGKEKDFTHRELMHRNPKTVNEDETSTGGSTSSGGEWESGVSRGKANPISNTGKYEYGTQRGKANPISNTSTYDYGTQRGHANPINEIKLNEQITRMKSILGLQESQLPQAIKKSVGDVLFGSNPTLAKIQKKPIEKNTPEEDRMITNLKNWTTQSTTQSEKGVVSTIADLVKLKEYFPEVLNPPYGEMVYRGTSIKLPQISNFIKQNPEHEIVEYNMVRFKTPFPYTPQREVSSWSTSLFYAASFQGKSFEGAINVPVIFETKVDNTFIMNPEVMNVIFKSMGDKQQDFYRDEDEVMKYNPAGTYYLIISDEEFDIFMGNTED